MKSTAIPSNAAAGRRYQNGELTDDGDRWKARYREDVILPATAPFRSGDKRLPSGEILHRQKRNIILASKKECPTRRMAERKLEQRIRQVNGQASTLPDSHHMIEVVLCDSCRQRLLSALSPGD